MKKTKECKCKDCGEINPENFYPKNKGRCKSCTLVLAKAKYSGLTEDLKSEYITKYRDWQKDNLVRYRVLSARSRADKKGMKFNLTEEYIYELLRKQNNKCYYTQIEFNNSSHVYSMSIDRIDSNKGYTVDNIRLVCSAVNYMKAEYSEDLFLALNKAIYLNNLA